MDGRGGPGKRLEVGETYLFPGHSLSQKPKPSREEAVRAALRSKQLAYRLQTFLPSMRYANEQLEQAARAGASVAMEMEVEEGGPSQAGNSAEDACVPTVEVGFSIARIVGDDNEDPGRRLYIPPSSAAAGPSSRKSSNEGLMSSTPYSASSSSASAAAASSSSGSSGALRHLDPDNAPAGSAGPASLLAASGGRAGSIPSTFMVGAGAGQRPPGDEDDGMLRVSESMFEQLAAGTIGSNAFLTGQGGGKRLGGRIGVMDGDGGASDGDSSDDDDDDDDEMGTRRGATGRRGRGAGASSVSHGGSGAAAMEDGEGT